MASFNIDNLDVFLAIFARITGFVYTAPFFSLRNVPQRAKILLSVAFSVIVFMTTGVDSLEYSGVIAYAGIILKDAVCGMILGLFATLANYILSMAGQMLDMEIGFSNIQEFDPTSNLNITISSTFFSYAVTLMLIVTDMHLFILKAVIDSFEVVPVGGVAISGSIYESFVHFILDYMIIAFRITLPVFAAILIVNTLLAILAKVAPQMNMFVVGFQLKIFVGLTVLIVMMMFLPSISDFIFDKMIYYMRDAIPYLTGGGAG
ncbi:MAG: flagellar biosynthetic protein FliR [Lachnospiraceae bacterium]|nr:flagellar biosynthetic protein FliR [Lachnospiraceae bacterium]